MFLRKTQVTYVNESNIDTFDPSFKIQKYEIDGTPKTELTVKDVANIRAGITKTLKVYF